MVNATCYSNSKMVMLISYYVPILHSITLRFNICFSYSYKDYYTIMMTIWSNINPHSWYTTMAVYERGIWKR